MLCNGLREQSLLLLDKLLGPHHDSLDLWDVGVWWDRQVRQVVIQVSRSLGCLLDQFLLSWSDLFDLSLFLKVFRGLLVCQLNGLGVRRFGQILRAAVHHKLFLQQLLGFRRSAVLWHRCSIRRVPRVWLDGHLLRDKVKSFVGRREVSVQRHLLNAPGRLELDHIRLFDMDIMFDGHLILDDVLKGQDRHCRI